MAHVADFESTHRVRLTGQRKRSAAGTTDFSRGEMQVANRVRVPGAVRALVQTHGPERGDFRRFANPFCGGANVPLAQAGDFRDARQRIIRQHRAQFIPALGVLRDEMFVNLAIIQKQAQQAVQQREVGARVDVQIQIRLLRRRRAARIHDNYFCALLLAVEQAQKQNRMAVGHVGADDQRAIQPVNVLILTRRPIRAERQLVSARRARHAQARIGINIVGCASE